MIDQRVIIGKYNQSVDVCCHKLSFILIQRGFKENGSPQGKKQMVGTLVLDPRRTRPKNTPPTLVNLGGGN
jgi:hypothetical protein